MDEIKILIVGGGNGGKKLIELFHEISTIKIVGVVDTDPEAPGLKFAEDKNIPVGNDFNKFIRNKEIDEILNVTGKTDIQEELKKAVPYKIDIINGHSSKLLWELMSEQLNIRRNVENAEKKFRTIFESTSDAVLILDNSKILEYNPQASALFGTNNKLDLTNKDLFSFLSPEQAGGAVSLTEASKRVKKAKTQGYQHFEWIFKRIDNGKTFPGEVLLTLINFDEKKMLLCSIRDISYRKKQEDELKRMSIYDSLTNLYSRSFFEKEMSKYEAESNSLPGIIVCDIDGLKLTNDTLGHDNGDRLIIRFAEILKWCFRQNDIVSRIGGDEFAVLLPKNSERILKECCLRLRKRIRDYNKKGPKIRLSISLGYAVGKNSEISVRELFKKADASMYQEKLRKSYRSRRKLADNFFRVLERKKIIKKEKTEKIENYVKELGELLHFTDKRLKQLKLLAKFYDLGKIGLPVEIFSKAPESLTEKEYENFKGHCEIGHRIASYTYDLAPIADFILKHHELWNGKGYPLGLKGNKIPMESQIILMADTYYDIRYNHCCSKEEAVKKLKGLSGSEFNPELVEKFINLHELSRD